MTDAIRLCVARDRGRNKWFDLEQANRWMRDKNWRTVAVRFCRVGIVSVK